MTTTDATPATALLTLTDLGSAVVAGAADALAGVAVDRWLGGTHLRTGGSLWRWDDAAGRLVPGR